MPLLEKLRGINSKDIVQNDFDRMIDGIIALRQENELEPKKGFWSKIPKTGSFWKPFGFLGITFFALHWSGFPALGFYMVTLLEKSKVPIGPFWASAMIAAHRAIMSIFGSFLMARYKTRTVYFSSCALCLFGLINLSTYLFFNTNDFLITKYPFMRWIPIISIMMIFTAFVLGYGSIPYILQVVIFSELQLT